MKKLILSGLAASALLFASCSDDDDNNPTPTPGGDDDGGQTTQLYNEDGTWTDETLASFEEKVTMNPNATGADQSVFDWTIAKGGITLNTDMGDAQQLTEITENTTLDQPKYEIQGAVFVRSGATLTIPEGTWFYADPSNNAEGNEGVNSADVLIIEQGAKIMAEGTAEKPIVFTSTDETSGSWGGIVILGKAPINLEGNTGIAEVSDNAGEDLTYGGDAADDNSGSLKYVSLAYPGTQINTDAEFNGFSFYSVGRKTILENLEVYEGKDDGYEWFGGTAEATNLYSHAYDDSFDWTDGWQGALTNIVADQPENAGYCIEADNLKADPNATPRSNPTIKDATLISSGAQDAAILFRLGTSVNLSNAVIEINKPDVVNINISDLVTGQLLLDNSTVLKDIKFDEENPYFTGNANK
ncbi:hypothetical protein [Zunongwangia sp.]|uniref:hypothetical protein n=1 Tax=Zunongwangia sp. TaxID=1965325 RepID=UPI003AA96925